MILLLRSQFPLPIFIKKMPPSANSFSPITQTNVAMVGSLLVVQMEMIPSHKVKAIIIAKVANNADVLLAHKATTIGPFPNANFVTSRGI